VQKCKQITQSTTNHPPAWLLLQSFLRSKTHLFPPKKRDNYQGTEIRCKVPRDMGSCPANAISDFSLLTKRLLDRAVVVAFVALRIVSVSVVLGQEAQQTGFVGGKNERR